MYSIAELYRYSRQASRDSTLEDGESVFEYARRKQKHSAESHKDQTQKHYIEPKKSVNKTGVNYSKMAELFVEDEDYG